MNKIVTSNDPEYIYIAKYLFPYHYKEMIPELIKRLTNDNEIGLNNSPDILILPRRDYGYSDGHAGTVSMDDLFKVSGRANYLLKRITGEDFGDVEVKSTKKELRELQKNGLNGWII